MIELLDEKLLEICGPVPQLHAYDVYQHLMDYWVETMQDDVYLLASAATRPAPSSRA